MRNLTRKLLITFCGFAMILAMVFSFGMLYSADAASSSTFSVAFKYSKDLLPKGVVGQEYDLFDVLTINTTGTTSYSIRYKKNFTGSNVNVNKNGKFTPDEYGVYSFTIIASDRSAQEKFEIYVESADGQKTFDYASDLNVTNGSFSYAEATVCYGNGIITPGTQNGGGQQLKANGLLLTFAKSGEFTFSQPIDFELGKSFISLGIAGGSSYDDIQGVEFDIVLTDASNPTNTVTFRPWFSTDCYYVKAGHSGMGGVLVGYNPWVNGTGALCSTSSYPGAFMSIYGAYSSSSNSSTMRYYAISEQGEALIGQKQRNSSTGKFEELSDPLTIAKLQDSSHMGENIWEGFSASQVYVSIKASKKCTLIVDKLGQYDLTDSESDAYRSTIVPMDPTIDVSGSSDFYSVGDTIDLSSFATTKGVYGDYYYSPLVNVSVEKVQGETKVPVSISGTTFQPEESGIYVCSYVAKDFDGNESETKKSVIVVLEQEVECVLSDVSYEDCDEGEEIDVQDATLTIGGTEYPAKPIVYYPDGSAHDVTKINTVRGLYRVEYRAFANDVLYTENVCFYARAKSYVTGAGYADVEYGTGDYPHYFSDNGLRVDIDKGETFVYDKVLDANEMTKDKFLIKFHINPSELGKPDVRAFYIRLTDVYDPDNFITIEIFTYDGDETSAYFRAAIGLGASAGYGGGIAYWNKYGGSTSSASLSGAGPYGKVDEANGNLDENGQSYYNLDLGFMMTFDYSAKNLYIGSERFFSNLEDLLLYGTPWGGFTTGECYMSIFCDDYTSEAPCSFIISEIMGNKIEDEFYHYDDAKPIINIDFDGYKQDNLPFGLKNVEYPIYDAVIYDGYTKNVKLTTEVFYDYYGAGYSITVADGKFKPTKAGTYTIVYTATDEFGNVSKEFVDVEVLEKNDMTTLSVAEKFKVTTANVGQSIIIPKLKAEFTNGRTENSVYVKFNNEIIATNVSSFVANKAGVYEVVYEVKDFLGTITTLKYNVTVTEITDVVLRENPSLPKFFIDEYSYELEQIMGYVYSNGVETELTAKLSVIDKNGKKVAVNNVVTPNVANSGDVITLVYEFTHNGSTLQKTFEVPVYKVYNYDEVNEEDKLDMSAYFVGDVASTSSDENSVSFKVSKDNADVYFLSDILMFGGKIQFSLPENLGNFESFVLTLTDSEDGVEEVALKFNIVGKNIKTVEYNGKEYSVGASNRSYTITMSADSKTISINGVEISLEVDTDGIQFNGFKRGRAYLKMTFAGVSGDAGLTFSVINNQQLNNMDYDIVKPFINIYEGFGGSYLIGDEYVIKLPVYADVLDPSTKLRLTVSTATGNVITATDGTYLNNVICNKEFTIKFEDIGTYFIMFNVSSITEKGGVYFWDEEFVYSLIVRDVVPPVITTDINDVITVKLGSEVTLPTVVVTDDHAKDVVAKVYLMTPQGTYVSLKAGKKSFVAEYSGEYKIIFLAIDDYSNVAIKTHTVVVK